MNHSVQIIPWLRLWLAFIPVILVIWLLFKWTREGRASIHAMARMLAQLMLVGYFLAFVFESDQPWIVTGVVAMMAVGLVSLPDMVTGQILSGVSPLIAARYQIMVMCMIFGAAGISSAVFLTLAKNRFEELRD